MRRALDLFCCGGGVAQGLQEAGFDVTGVDLNPECAEYYPGAFILADATKPPVDIRSFDFIWASPPCQAFSVASNPRARALHPDLTKITRELLAEHRLTCIENVPSAPIRKDLILSGPTVGLHRILRRRVFELSFDLKWACPQPPVLRSPRSEWEAGRMCSITKSLRAPASYYTRRDAGLKGEIPVAEAREVMGITIPDLPKEMVGEAVPPPMARYIGERAMLCLEGD